MINGKSQDLTEEVILFLLGLQEADIISAFGEVSEKHGGRSILCIKTKD